MEIYHLKTETFFGLLDGWREEDATLPLLGTDPRNGQKFAERVGDTSERKILRVERHTAAQGQFTTSDGLSHSVGKRQFDEISVEPLYVRHAEQMSNSDLVLYGEANEVVQKLGMKAAQGEDVFQKATRKALAFAKYVARPGREAIHAALVGALLGSFTYYVNDAPIPVSYGINTLDVPGTASDYVGNVAWTNTTADVPADILGMKRQHADANGGLEPDTVFFHPTFLAKYILRNEEWKDYVKAVPDLARAFAGAGGASAAFRGMWARMEAFFAFNMLWVPISGSALHPITKAATARFPTNVLVFATMWADPETPLIQHFMTLDLYTPTEEETPKVWRTDEPEAFHLRVADNIAVGLARPELISKVTVEA